ncbi:hypothetical protein Ciccas_007572, partial [Cichlidogyrus casuarinus]
AIEFLTNPDSKVLSDEDRKHAELLIRRLFNRLYEDESAREKNTNDEPEAQTILERFYAATKREVCPISSWEFNTLGSELTVLKGSKQLGPKLQCIYKALLSVRPTSIDSERVFSVA